MSIIAPSIQQACLPQPTGSCACTTAQIRITPQFARPQVQKARPHDHTPPAIPAQPGVRNTYLFTLLTLELLTLSPLPLTTPTLLLLDLLRILLLSSGSVGCRPLALAKRFRISVRLTTPANLPACAPGRADAEMEGVALRGRKGGWDCGIEERWDGGWETEGVERGLWGREGVGIGVVVAAEMEGEGESVTHILSLT